MPCSCKQDVLTDGGIIYLSLYYLSDKLSAIYALQTPQQQDMDSCAHVESCLAAAEAAECPLDWSNFLVQYVTLLARQGDTARLDALCTSLLGPLSWNPSSCQPMPAGAQSSWAGGLELNSACASTHVRSSGARTAFKNTDREQEAVAGAANADHHRQNGYCGTGECEGQGVCMYIN